MNTVKEDDINLFQSNLSLHLHSQHSNLTLTQTPKFTSLATYTSKQEKTFFEFNTSPLKRQIGLDMSSDHSSQKIPRYEKLAKPKLKIDRISNVNPYKVCIRILYMYIRMYKKKKTHGKKKETNRKRKNKRDHK